MQPNLNFNRTTVIDPTSGAQQALNNIGNLMNNAERIRTDRSKQEALLAQQALANKRADAQLAMQQEAAAREASKYKQGLEQDKILSDLYRNVPDTVTTSKTVNTPSNEDAFMEATMNNAMLQTEQHEAEIEADNRLDNLPKIYSPAKPVDELTNRIANTQQYLKVLDNTANADPKQVDSHKKLILDYSKELSTPGINPERKNYLQEQIRNSNAAVSYSSYSPAQREALKTKLQNDLTSYQSKLAEPVAPSSVDPDAVRTENNVLADRLKQLENQKVDIPELVKASSKTIDTTTKLTAAEKADALRKDIMSSSLTGRNMQVALKEVDNLYPEAKALTETEKLNRRKYEDAVKQDIAVVSDYKSIFPNMPEGIDSVKGAMAYMSLQTAKTGNKPKYPTAQELALAKVYKKRIDDGVFSDDDTTDYDNALAIINAAESRTGSALTEDKRW